MGTFRRWTMSILSSFESVVHQIENHEAMVSSAIREAEENGARAKAQLMRVKKDGAGMRKRIIEVREQVAIWRERAKRTADSEETKAIECLRRSKKLEKQLADLELQEREHSKLERNLAQDLATVEERLVVLRQQRNLMRTRQSRAEALRLIQQVDSSAVSEIDDIFTRWEAQVSACEARADVVRSDGDDLSDEFVTQEEENELREALRELVDENRNAEMK